MRTIAEIVAAAEAEMKLPPGLVADALRHRTHEVCLARHVAYYVARKETRWSFALIAEAILGRKDHKAVMHGFNRVSVALKTGDREVVELVNAVAPDLEV